MMIEAAGQTLHRIPIRVRLTLWYVILFGGTLSLLSVYLLARFQHSLQTSLDGALQLAANQTLAVIEDTHGPLAFQDNHELANIPASFPGLAIRLLSPDGQVLDQRGGFDDEPAWGPLASGYVTRFRFEDDTPWRTYTVPLRAATGQVSGWLQVTQSLNETTDTLQDLRDQLFLMHRCGIDSFQVREDKDIEDALKAFNEFSVKYQTAADGAEPIYRLR